MQLVVPSAVRKAVSAATTTFTAISKIRLDFITLNSKFSTLNSKFSILNSQLSILNSQLVRADGIAAWIIAAAVFRLVVLGLLDFA